MAEALLLQIEALLLRRLHVRAGILRMVLRPDFDPFIDEQVHPDPDDDVHRENQRHIHEPQQQRVEADVHHHDAQYGHEHPTVPHPGAQQLVVDVVAIRQEGVAVLAQTVQHHPRDIQQRHDERRQRQHEIARRVIARGAPGSSGCSRA